MLGLIIGALIRYTMTAPEASKITVPHAYNWSSNEPYPPDIVVLSIASQSNNTTESFQYSYQSKIILNTVSVDELESKV